MPESGTLNDIVGGRPNCSKMSVRQPYATASWHHLVSNRGIRQGPSSKRLWGVAESSDVGQAVCLSHGGDVLCAVTASYRSPRRSRRGPFRHR
jgi:hypothetical protein